MKDSEFAISATSDRSVLDQGQVKIAKARAAKCVAAERPETAAFLRTLGAKSVGRATLQTYMQSFEEENKAQTPNPPKAR